MRSKSLRWAMRLCIASTLAGCAVAAFAVPSSAGQDSGAAESTVGDTPMDRGYAYLEAGKYRPALLEFERARADAEARGDAALAAEIHSASGYTLYLLQRPVEAKEQLELALAMASKNHDDRLEGRVRGYLGLVYAEAEKNIGQAKEAFGRSEALAHKAGDTAMEYAMRLQSAKLETDPARHLGLLQTLATDMRGARLDDSSRVDLLLNLADQLKHLREEGQTSLAIQRLGHTVAEEALALAEKTGRHRAQSQIEGYGAGWYEAEGKTAEAIRLVGSAIRDADTVDAPDLAMQWQAMLGRLLARQGRLEDAIDAYRRSVFYVGEIRNDIPVVYQNGKSSYRETLEPIYRGLADLLLRQAALTKQPEDRQRLLLESINALERLKQSEMEDYFNDRCAMDSTLSEIKASPRAAARFFTPSATQEASPHAVSLAANLASATGGTAILYPVVFDDRLELLLVHDGLIQQKTVSASRNQVTKEAAAFNALLRDKKVRYEAQSRQLYQWIVAPLEADLRAAHIDRIVYVPDGSLRLAPLAAFNGGQGFVAEHYAVVTNSGLQFTPVQRLGTDPVGKALLAGLSVPDGPSLDSVPANLIHPAGPADKATRGVGDEATGGGGKTPATPRAKVVQALSLPGVTEEIHMIGETLPNTTLLNRTFTSKNLEDDIQSGNYRLVHISSHGYFGHSAEDSFIMTYDKTLDVNDVERVISLDPEREQQPIELVTFSACQTAKGDDRAPLGFSGIAIKANARNALGTLWNVPDLAAKQFMQDYYAALAASDGDTVMALQQAQKAMIRQKFPLNHPAAWAAFILVGAW